ncbi:MAG TPA: hypothetical protein EYO58_11915, partial [Flavobacteriales bacterium]|nr:hypothetical protein [Flavobacteriales bacterium]
MEKHDITIRHDEHEAQEVRVSIIEACTRKTDVRNIWRWTKRQQLQDISDLLYSNGDEREDIWSREPPELRSVVRAQTAPHIAKYRKQLGMECVVFARGRWVCNNQEENKYYGQIVGQMPRKRIQVREWTRSHRRWTKGDTRVWKTDKCVEVMAKGSATNRIIEFRDLRTIQEMDSTIDEIQENVEGQGVTPKDKNVGLWNLGGVMESYTWLQMRAQHVDQTICAVSDGSVRDGQTGGTFAWALIHKGADDMYEQIGVEAMGRERWGETKLATHEAHSYRMEALGLLSVLHYLRTEMQWQGSVEVHMDSKSVIDTYKKCRYTQRAKWHRQRDKDVWKALKNEKIHWGNRAKIHQCAITK